MSKLAMMAMAMLVSVSAFAGDWKLVASDSIWSKYPQMRNYAVNSKEAYSNILVRVTRGNLRIQNAFLGTVNHGEMPLWPIQGDYRSPRDSGMVFPADQIRNMRLTLSNIDSNVPAQFYIYMR